MERENPQKRNAKISVIVPIYKVEPYLRQCLDSIIHQTYENLEILLIDDGSPDRCGAICDEYAEKDVRIRVTHKKNGGLSAAWNDGLQMATGEWVAFVDSDDWVDLDVFEKLMSVPNADSADVILSGGYYWEDGREDCIRWAFLEPFDFTGAEKDSIRINVLMRPSDPRTKGVMGYVWGKLFRTSFVRSNGLKFDPKIPTGYMGDVLFCWKAFERAERILGTFVCGYHYRITPGSGTYKFDAERPIKQEYVQEQFYKELGTDKDSDQLRKAMESRCLRDIVHNLQRCYFHPENPASRREIAAGIREMKRMPYYRAAIISKNNPYNGFGLRVFQWILRLPWIWPLRMIIAVWNAVDKRE